jgi:hypothetical protein
MKAFIEVDAQVARLRSSHHVEGQRIYLAIEMLQHSVRIEVCAWPLVLTLNIHLCSTRKVEQLHHMLSEA